MNVYERITARTVEGPTISEVLGPCLDSLYSSSDVQYPQIEIKGKQYRITRLVLQSKLERPIRKGYQANHHCDRPICIRPKHLYEGTQAENMQDVSQRGSKRQTITGEKNPSAKLNDDAIRVIRFLAAKGYTQKRLGNAHGVSEVLIGKIVNRKLWTHVLDIRPLLPPAVSEPFLPT